MKDLLNQEYKCMLWKDEIGDDFLLLKYAEVYKYSDKILRMHIFSWKKLSQLRKMGVILNEIELDEPFTIIDIKVSDLDKIIQLGYFKSRPSLKGAWIKDKEEKLAHKIIPYNPQLN